MSPSTLDADASAALDEDALRPLGRRCSCLPWTKAPFPPLDADVLVSPGRGCLSSPQFVPIKNATTLAMF